MDPRPIAEYLKRFINLAPPEKEQKKILNTTIKKFLNIEVGESKIRINNGIAHVALSSVRKTEVFLNKKEILKSANEQLALNKQKNLVDIQ